MQMVFWWEIKQSIKNKEKENISIIKYCMLINKRYDKRKNKENYFKKGIKKYIKINVSLVKFK